MNDHGYILLFFPKARDAKTEPLHILMAQINPTIGAIRENAQVIREVIQTHQQHHDLIIFPELTLTGYPPEDLLLRPELFNRIDQALQDIQSVVSNHVILGHPSFEAGHYYNTASLIAHKTEVYALALYRNQLSLSSLNAS